MLSHQIFYKRRHPEVIIIGGGASGVAAFQRLHEKGFTKIKIIEAEDRLGGRVKTVALGDKDIDLGAHWVHGEDTNTVYKLAGPGLLEHTGDFTKIDFVYSNGAELPSGTGMALYAQFSSLLEEEENLSNSDGSLLDYFSERGKPMLDNVLNNETNSEAFLNWMISFECTVEGCDSLDEASAKGLTHYKLCPGDLLISWKKGGYSNIIDLLMRPVYKQKSNDEVQDSIILNCEVTQLDYTGMGVLVKCNNGKVYYGDHAIITVSLGVLKEKGNKLFDPPLPNSKRKAIAGLGIGTINKIYLLFPYMWWPEDCSGFSLLWLSNDKNLQEGQFPWELDIIGFYKEKRLSNTLTAWLAGKSAREMESYSEEQVKDGCYRVLKKFLSHKFSIPEPVQILRSNWYSNPHFRGCYSFRSLNSDALGVTAADLAAPLKNHFGREVVLFAGEATHSSYYSTVHGAIETGWREADRIAAMYHREKQVEFLKSSL